MSKIKSLDIRLVSDDDKETIRVVYQDDNLFHVVSSNDCTLATFDSLYMAVHYATRKLGEKEKTRAHPS